MSAHTWREISVKTQDEKKKSLSNLFASVGDDHTVINT